jgi:hypothetical protein
MKNILLIICLLFCFGCSNKIEIKPIEISKSNFIKSEKFILKDIIEKPEKPSYLLLDDTFQLVDDTDLVSYFAFSVDEFPKIIALSKSFDNQQLLITQLVNIININIDEINSLKDLIESKDQLANNLNLLYMNEQQQRLLEKQDYKFQHLIDKIFIVIQSGVIITLAIIVI